MDLFNEWYSKKDVMYEIVKQLSGKETAFINPTKKDILAVRGVKAHSLRFLELNMDRFDFFKYKFNIYNSCADLNNMPTFSFEPEERKKQYQDFRINFDLYITGYDLLLDFDSKKETFEKCKEEVTLVKSLFDDYKVPYYLIFSGSGFHIIVPNTYIPKLEKLNRNEICDLICRELVTTLSLTTLDMGIYDIRRIKKVPFSYDIKTDRIALPLSDLNFKNFNYNMVLPEKLLKIDFYNYPIFLRNKDSNMEKFMNEFVFGN